MTKASNTHAISDSASPDTMDTDINGAQTAVGVPHPENRLNGRSVPALDFLGLELDDYDDAQQQSKDMAPLPADQDVGESFEDVTEIGNPTGHRHGRSDQFPKAVEAIPPRATSDLQGIRPNRSQSAEPDTEVRGL